MDFGVQGSTPTSPSQGNVYNNGTDLNWYNGAQYEALVDETGVDQNFVTKFARTFERNAVNASSVTGIATANSPTLVVCGVGCTDTQTMIRNCCLKVTGVAGNNAIVDVTIDTIDAFRIGKPLYFSIKTKAGAAYAAGNWTVKIYNSTDAADATTATAIPAGEYQTDGFFIPVTGKTYVIRFNQVLGTTNAVFYMDDLKVTNQEPIYASNITDWVSFTPTVMTYATTTATNITSSSYKMRIVGDTCQVHGKITFSGAANAVGEIRLYLPPNMLADSAKVAGTDILGVAAFYTNSKFYGAEIFYTDTGYVTIYPTDAAGSSTVSWTGSTTAGDNKPSGAAIAVGDYITVEYCFPIAGKSSNIQLGNQALVEYAYNTAVADSADTTSFGYGPSGVLFASLTADRLKRISFQTPPKPTDTIMIEVSENQVEWVNVSHASTIISSATTGMALVAVTATTMDVNIRRYISGTTNWPTSALYWRVKKISTGGYPGLPLSARNIIGDTSGTVVPAGFVGEYRNAIGGSYPAMTTAQFSDGASAGLLLTPGTYDLQAIGYFNIGVTTTISRLQVSIGTVAGNDGTGVDLMNNTTCFYYPSTFVPTNDMQFSTPLWRVTVPVGSTTVYYPKGFAGFATSTLNFKGNITARRIA